MSESLLCINLPPQLELELIDWLLQHEIEDFTSMSCSGHGHQHALESIAEKVAGKASRVEVQVRLGEEQWPALVSGLGEAFAGADILYWVLPVLCSGSLVRD